MSKVLRFPVTFEKKSEITIEDKRFTSVKIWLMHLGQNKNGTIFEKEFVDKAIPSLAYIPIVGFIEENKDGNDDFSNHRLIVVKDKETGEKKAKYIGNGYGVILSEQDNNAHYEDKICDDGETRTFLVVDGIVWNMFDTAKEIIDRDVIKYHSMELDENSYDGYEDEDGIYHFTDFSFRAACILGGNYQSGMTGSVVETQFTVKDVVTSLQSNIIKNVCNYERLQFNKNKGVKMPHSNFALTDMQKIEEVKRIMSNEKYMDRWHEEAKRYSFIDIQDSEVIYFDYKDRMTYGSKISVNGDVVEIDFETKVRKKISYVDFVDGDVEVVLPQEEELEVFEQKYGEVTASLESAQTELEELKSTTVPSSKFTALEETLKSVKTDFEKLQTEHGELVEKENKRIKENEKVEKQSLFTRYEGVIGEHEDFKALKNNADEYSVDDVKVKCAIMFSEAIMSNGSAKSLEVGLVVDDCDNEKGYINTKYGKIKISE